MDAPPPRYGSPAALRPAAASVPRPCTATTSWRWWKEPAPVAKLPADGRVVHVHPRRTLATRRSPSAPPGEAAGWGSEDRTEEVLGLVIGYRGGESERAEDGRGGDGGRYVAPRHRVEGRRVGDQSFGESDVRAARREGDEKEDESDSGVTNTNLPKYPFTFD